MCMPRTSSSRAGFGFFFSSRRRHTRFDCDWSSDVCSSDLDRADCALPTAVGVADDGGARLGRMMLLDRIARSPQAETRERAQYYLRYRLPDHDVPRIAEALNATGWRLQHVHDAPDEALVVFQKAIEADPRFSWPHHNIGRIYMAKANYEQARVWLERALAVNPHHLGALYHYRLTTANLKRLPEALSP